MAKHPVPKKKTSRARGNRRYKDFQNKARVRLTNAVTTTKCPKCGAAMQLHHVCTECGYYKGKDVLRKVAKVEEKVTKIKAD